MPDRVITYSEAIREALREELKMILGFLMGKILVFMVVLCRNPWFI